jgi:hypothetical protein
LKPFNEGEIIKEWTNAVADVVFPRQTLRHFYRVGRRVELANNNEESLET